MPLDGLLVLLRNLHFNSGKNQDDRLHKICPIVVAENFRTMYVPTQHICTNESLWKFKGRIRFEPYNLTKCAQFGIEVYNVCQTTGRACGYIWTYKIYTGQDRLVLSVSIRASTDVMLLLNENLFDKGYNFYMDNWFSSPDLFLQMRRTNSCGTVKMHRKNMPPDLQKIKLLSGKQYTNALILAFLF
ncbi:uncharacterized protein LOC115231483 [Octopus sinensis]|uniref:Uncharacterized protein LOC115229082 n=1 Tax=Octopus sinensis TaxID=2607531 RepID=A0A6P7TZK6_9MOLL|nr:uncharacterized protein LOC115229082 [Octopus sinensis]XP_029657360.1 uncharacterized protein LOC115231483 [Octopus sinensis]